MLLTTCKRLTSVIAALVWVGTLVWPGVALAVTSAQSYTRWTPSTSQRVAPTAWHQFYSVKELGTFGGTLSNASGINDTGWVVGDANLTGDVTEHASLWRHGVITDLGTLGGLNSGVGYPAMMDDRGLIAGNAQTSAIDPLGESWGLLFGCTASFGACQGYQNLVRGFVWQHGVITALPTLGGNNAVALGGVNNRGQMIGYAESNVRNPNCATPQVLAYSAVIWGPGRGDIHQLPTFPADSITAAFGINDRGDAVGTSGPCGFPSFAIAQHAVLWHNGSVINLGGFGGAMSNVALAINDSDQVVGLSDVAGDATAHAFFWSGGAMTDLGTLPGDYFSIAQAINDRGQIVGQSCDQNGNCRAFLWQNGVMIDLNALTPPGSPLFLTAAEDIDSHGAIVGSVFDQRNGETLGFVAIPTGGWYLSPTQTLNQTRRIILPERVRTMLQRRRVFGRF
jgi:probable HAF family extracellular repeat protein